MSNAYGVTRETLAKSYVYNIRAYIKLYMLSLRYMSSNKVSLGHKIYLQSCNHRDAMRYYERITGIPSDWKVLPLRKIGVIFIDDGFPSSNG
jgi:hypothetical protein